MGVVKERLTLNVNGVAYSYDVGRQMGQVRPSDTLAKVIREKLGLLGTKISCDDGACGCCTVIIDGEAIPSCSILAVECEGREITTIEGLEDRATGQLSELQQAFVDNSAFQCGYCTPGIIMTSKILLDKNPRPTEPEIREALAGNYCRCISHYQVIKAVQQAAGGAK